jgi:hypothetical protein
MPTPTIDTAETDAASEVSSQRESPAQHAHKQAVLAKIEAGLVELESQIAKLDSLSAEQARLAGEVQKTESAEAELLRDESLSEAAATRKLIETRAKADVLRARVKTSGERIDEQKHLVLETGAVLRRALSRTAYHILVARENRIVRLLDDLIPPQSESGLQCDNLTIARASHPVVEARQFSNWVACRPVPVPAEELETVRGGLPRTWLDRIKVFASLELDISIERLAYMSGHPNTRKAELERRRRERAQRKAERRAARRSRSIRAPAF